MSSISDHIIIAGWSEEVPMLLSEMRAEYGERMPSIIVFASRERPDELDQEYLFVRGDFRKEREYDKVRLKFARAVVAVADGGADSSSALRDASTVLTVFTIRAFEKQIGDERTEPLHLVAEILDPENAIHAKVAGANEVIETTRLGSSVLAHTACNIGVSSVISTLVQASNNNVYFAALPAELREGELMTFGTLQERAREEFGVLVIGVEHDGELNLNPPITHTVFLRDKMVYIGDHALT